ncbi:MAG: ferredoxin-thioredoxin reductase catalytic domain-containing protein [Desulfitobacteriaceae bacterium]
MGKRHMYSDFIRKAWRFRKEIQHHQAWMQKYASKQGYRVNLHAMYRTNLIIWLEENKRLYQRPICPCFEASGDPELDRQLICPCTFCEEDIQAKGSCHCGLFGRSDFTESDFKQAEARVMREYRIPLRWQGTVLDTTGQRKDSLRGLPVPDAMHQFKQARNERPRLDFDILCEEEQSARNIQAYLKNEGIASESEKEDKSWLLKIRSR